MDDGDVFVQTHSEKKDFAIPNTPFTFDFDNSDFLTEFNVSKGPTDLSIKIQGHIA